MVMVVQVREGMTCWVTGSRMASSSSGWATWLWSVSPNITCIVALNVIAAFDMSCPSSHPALVLPARVCFELSSMSLQLLRNLQLALWLVCTTVSWSVAPIWHC